MHVQAYLEERGKPFWAIAGMVFVLAIGVIEYHVSYEISFSLFYLLAISAVTWFGGRWIGIATSVAAISCWITVDVILLSHGYSHPVIPFLNFTIRFIVFLIVVLLLSALRKAQDRERELARIDFLTGAVNKRFFSELMQMELERAERNGQPFTVVYFDIDNFKYVNDHYGHATGDKVLCATVTQAKNQLRKIDVVARLGGDEFAFLLPGTDQAAASVAVPKVQIGLMDEMRKNGWPVTYSIGVLTCMTPPKSIDEVIKLADELMYSVKNKGKNAIRYSVFAASQETP